MYVFSYRGLSNIDILGKKAWFSGNTCFIKTISHGILILIEGSKAQYIRNEMFLSSNL